LSEELSTAWGLAWHPGGELWYTGSTINAGQGRTVMMYGVDMAGKSREVFSSPGVFFLHDIAADGTVLVTRETFNRSILGHVDGVVRDLSWFDWSFPTRLSEDGRMLLFEEQGVASGGVYAVYLRDTGGGPAIRLDEGQGRDISSDGTSVLSFSDDLPEKLMIIPTGAGEVRVIPVGGVHHFLTARYLPGEREIVLIGSRNGEGSRLWRVNATGGEADPISDQGISFWPFFAISPDGEWVTAVGADQLPAIYPVHGNEGPRPIKGIRAGDVPIHWPHAGHIFICEREEKRALIVEIDLETGDRRLAHTLAPPDPAGVQGVFPIYFSRDSKSYVFGYRVSLSTLVIATGIQ
jgi:hypothetical protein